MVEHQGLYLRLCQLYVTQRPDRGTGSSLDTVTGLRLCESRNAAELGERERAQQVGGAGLAGVLPGLGSSMTRGPYAGWQLGQALDLPAMCTSGPLVLLDAGPGPGRWLKPWSRPAPATAYPFLQQAADCCVRGTGAGRAGAGRRQERRPGRGPGRARRAERAALMR
jgi:hypothetical protein